MILEHSRGAEIQTRDDFGAANCQCRWSSNIGVAIGEHQKGYPLADGSPKKFD
jgi:hypothetical protein